MLSLSDFRLTRSRSLSIGGWQPSRRRRRFHFLVCRGQRWPSSGVSFAETGLRRAGEGSASCFLSGFPADAIAVFIHWRVAAEPAVLAISFFSLSRAALAGLGGRLRRDRLAPGW